MNERFMQNMRRVGEVMGMVPRPVPLPELARNLKGYNGKWVETNGLYIQLGKRLVEDVDMLPGGTLIGPVPVPRFVVAEHGLLLSDSGHGIRVYKETGFASSKSKAEERLDEAAEREDVTFNGDVMEGFPGEFYMHSGYRRSIVF